MDEVREVREQYRRAISRYIVSRFATQTTKKCAKCVSPILFIHSCGARYRAFIRYTVGMFWRYSRGDSKILLLATLLVFSAYALLIGTDVRDLHKEEQRAQTIGVFASVPENEYSATAAQLEARARELESREAALREVKSRPDTRTMLIVSIIGSVLLGLILLNFYLDHVRRRSMK